MNNIITDIKSNDPFDNELNVFFRNSTTHNRFNLTWLQKYKLKFYQKFIRKIVMGHYKIFLYKLIFKVLND